MFFDNLKRAQLPVIPTAGFQPMVEKAKTCSGVPRDPEGPQAAYHRNSHVFYILPVTTLRTIDLGGKKISDPLFSRFCAQREIFLSNILHQKLCIRTAGR
jgi:hypothetical protein